MSHTPWHLDLDRNDGPGQSGFGGLQNFSVAPGDTQTPANNGFFGDIFGDTGFGLNKGTLEGVSSGLGGIGKLASGWAAIKQLGLAKDAFKFKKDFADRNFEASMITTNNRIRDQNAWKAAQGRTDLAKLVV